MSAPVMTDPVAGSVDEFVAIFDAWQAGKRKRDVAATVRAAGRLRGWIWSAIRPDPTHRDVQMDRVLTEAYARGYRMGLEDRRSC